MNLMYSSQNKIKFTSISEKFALPSKFKGQQSKLHGEFIEYVVKHFQNTRKYKQTVVDALNILTYCVIASEAPTFDWKLSDPFNTIPEYDMDMIEEATSVYFLTMDAIDWDVSEADDSYHITDAQVIVPSAPTEPQEDVKIYTPSRAEIAPDTTPIVPPQISRVIQEVPEVSTCTTVLTPKEDLYIQPPKYPQFDFSKPWLSVQDKGDQLVIYTTIPEIPTKQNEISVTTDPDKMTVTEMMMLYPKQFIRTRAPIMYEPQEGLDFDPELGCILPIDHYSREELIDNIIRYPHFYKLKRMVDGEIVSMYEDIEIDGELLSTEAVWDSLPESLKIPKQSDFIKEYVVRRYILEEEHGIKHKYPMYGTLKPFLTLFMPPEGYIKRGYKETEQIVKCCIDSRISFKRSRNPILKRIGINLDV